jgi:hypothetical protein
MPNEYYPNPIVPTRNSIELGNYLVRELERIADSLREKQDVTFTIMNAFPDREPPENEVRLAYFDFGNPAQDGLYFWGGTAWKRLLSVP